MTLFQEEKPMRVSLKLLLLLCCVCSFPANAVQRNPLGLGEVLIYPYHAVNKDLNFLYPVVNTANHSKAVKIDILQGDIGH